MISYNQNQISLITRSQVENYRDSLFLLYAQVDV